MKLCFHQVITSFARRSDKKFGIDLQSPSWSPYFFQILLGSTLPNCQGFPSLLSRVARCRRQFLVQALRGRSSSGDAVSFGGKMRKSSYCLKLTFFSMGMFRKEEKASARDSFILWRQRCKVDNEFLKRKKVENFINYFSEHVTQLRRSIFQQKCTISCFYLLFHWSTSRWRLKQCHFIEKIKTAENFVLMIDCYTMTTLLYA